LIQRDNPLSKCADDAVSADQAAAVLDLIGARVGAAYPRFEEPL
jgi:hypothetical protein